MQLTLAQQLLLLALKDEKGSVIMSSSMALPYGLVWAITMELFMKKRLAFNEKKVVVLDASPTEDPLQDEALAIIKDFGKQKDAKYWVQKLASKIKKSQDRIAAQLVEQGILRKEEHEFLWLIPYKRYPTQNAEPEKDIRYKVRGVISGRYQLDDRSAALLSLIKACELTNEVFDKFERKEAKRLVKEIAKDDRIGQAVTGVVNEVNAAVMAAVMASVAASTAVSSS